MLEASRDAVAAIATRLARPIVICLPLPLLFYAAGVMDHPFAGGASPDAHRPRSRRYTNSDTPIRMASIGMSTKTSRGRRIEPLTTRGKLAAFSSAGMFACGSGKGLDTATGDEAGCVVNAVAATLAAGCGCTAFDSVNACSTVPDTLTKSTVSACTVTVNRTAPKCAGSRQMLPGIGA